VAFSSWSRRLEPLLDTSNYTDTVQSASPDIGVSVIVASVEAEGRISDCLESVMKSARGHAVEVIVVDASRDGSARLVRLSFPDAQLVDVQPGTLTPVLWAEGLARSRGHTVAFTTANNVVSQSWLSELSSGLESGAAGVGGPISLASRSSLTDAAIYFLRYSAFMPRSSANVYETAEIPGDNSLYRRDALDRHSAALRDGFWEVELHDVLRSEGERLVMVPAAEVEFGRSAALGVISRQRFAHGKHYGRWRVVGHGVSIFRIVFALPLVPFVMLTRGARRVRAAGGSLRLFTLCSPIFLWLAACWAFGEAVGSITTSKREDANRR